MVGAQQWHQQLEQERAQAAARLDRLTSSRGEDALDPVDQQVFQHTCVKLHKLDRALERLSKESYGVCTMCRQPIDEERLETLPEATLCVNCQQQQEQTAKGRHRLNQVSNVTV